MALGGDVGATLDADGDHGFWFGEDQARYVLAVADADAALRAADAAGVSARALGRAGGDGLKLADGSTISLARLREAHERFLPAWMEG